MFVIETVTEEAKLWALTAEWNALCERISPRVPFSTPLWCRLWWQHYRRRGVIARDDLRSYVVRDRAGALVAVMPMFVSRRPGVGPIVARELQFLGADPYVTELRGPVCLPETSLDVVRALVRHFETETAFDWIQWRGLRLPSQPVAMPGDFRPDAGLATTDYVLPLPATWDELRGQLPRNIKESLRKCYNSLARDKVEFRFEVLSGPEGVAAAVDRFIELHGARAEVKGTVGHANVFSGARPRAFLHDYCASLAEAGGLRIFRLVIGGEVVATRIAFALGDELYLYFSGYDARWGRYSVMTTAVVEAIKWAIANGFRLVNLSTGTDVSKTRWRPEAVEYFGGFSVSPTWPSRAAFALVQRLRKPVGSAHREARRSLERVSPADGLPPDGAEPKSLRV